MIKSFITSFKLKNTYRVNSIIYSLKQITIIKKILPSSLYKSRILKVIGNIISIIIEFGSIFLGKFLYIFFCIFSMLTAFKTNQMDTFIHIFTFLAISGGIMNTYMFNPTKDKYYAMIIMNMDAKKYTLSNYYYSLIKVVIGFLPFSILFGRLVEMPLIVSLILPIFVVMVKVTISTYNLYHYEKTKTAKNENLPDKVSWAIIAGLVLVAYGLPFLGITINSSILVILFIISLITGVFSFIKVNNFKYYKQMYKQVLTPNNIHVITSQTSTQMIKEANLKQIEYEADIASDKNGFAYFHELFVKRHSKILTKSVKKQSLIILAIFIVAITIAIFNKEFGKSIGDMLLNYLPYFVFIMYMLNRGTVVTQAMFMNCDHSMLTYRIYRTPKIILGLFKERLKTLILINLFPAVIIAVGLPLLLFVTGGTANGLNYIVLFVSIIAMSIFFSVHYLILYYLLQPYTASTEMKSSTYQIAQGLTYFVCYCMINIELPTISFGLAMSAFCIIYSLVSLILVYRFAPKTFKLRL